MENNSCTSPADEDLSSATIESDVPFSPKSIHAALNHFPALPEVAYPKCTESDYMSSLFMVNNAVMAKIFACIAKAFPDGVANRSLLFDLICDPVSQQKLAEKSGVDLHFVRLLISRAIAWQAKISGSPEEAAIKIQVLQAFWDENQKQLLLSLLAAEDLLLNSLFRLQAHITNLVFYKKQYIDFICSHAVSLHSEVLRKIRSEHLPYRTAEISKRNHLNCYKAKYAVINAQEYLNDEKKLNALLVDIRYLEKEEKGDPFYGKLAKHLLHEIYEKLVLDEAAVLGTIFNKIYRGLSQIENWNGDIKKSAFAAKQIAQLIKECSSTDTNPQIRYFNFCSHHCMSYLTEIFLDYHGLSCLGTLPALCRLIEDIGMVFSEPFVYTKKGIDRMFEDFDYAKHHNDQVRQLLTKINAFLHAYEMEYLQLDDGLLPTSSRSFHPLFRDFGDCLPKHRLFDECQFSLNKGSKEKSDQETVNYLMRTYFPDELVAKKSDAPSKKKKSKKKPTTIKTITTTTTMQREQTPLVAPKQETMKTCALSSAGPRTIAPRYHDRVLRWFQSDFAQQYPPESVLYHTYAPAADWFIINEGSKDLWQNDAHYRRYSLPGRIIKADNSCAYVICGCTLLSNGQIYHRGYRFPTQQEWQQIGIADEAFDRCPDSEEKPFTIMQKESHIRNRSSVVSDTERSIILFDHVNNIYVQLYRVAAHKPAHC